MLALFFKLIVAAWFLLWGTRAKEVDVQVGAFAGPVDPAEVAIPREAPQLLLKMAADGTMTFEGKAITDKDLEKLLAARAQQDPATALKIEIAPGLPQDKLFDIVDLAENAGIDSIATDPHVDIPPAATFEIGE